MDRKSNKLRITRRPLHFLSPKTYVLNLDQIESITVESVTQVSKYRKFKPNFKIDITSYEGFSVPLTSSLFVKRDLLRDIARQMCQFINIEFVDDVDDSNEVDSTDSSKKSQ